MSNITKLRLNKQQIKELGKILIANPQEEATSSLTKINIDGVVYEVVGGSSGGGLASVEKAVVFTDTDAGLDVETEFTNEEFDTLFNENSILTLALGSEDENMSIAQDIIFTKVMATKVEQDGSIIEQATFIANIDAGAIMVIYIYRTNGEITHEIDREDIIGNQFIKLEASDTTWSDLTFAEEIDYQINEYEPIVAVVSVGDVHYFSSNVVLNEDINALIIIFPLDSISQKVVLLTKSSSYFDTVGYVIDQVGVAANNGEETTATLSTLKIGTTNYALESGGSEIVDINNLSVIPTDYQDIEKLKNVILLKNDLYYELTYADSDYLYYTNTYELAYNRISVSLIDYSINQADTINIDRIFVVEITDVPNTATNGTLTETQLATLQASDSNYIMFNNEKYYLNDKGHTEGYLTYSHLGATNDNIIAKTITITISTRAWVLLEEQVGGSSGGGIVELEELPSVVDENSPDLVLVRGIIYEKVANNVLGQWTLKDEFPNIGEEEKFFYVDGITSGTSTSIDGIVGLSFKNNTINLATSGSSSSGFITADNIIVGLRYKNIQILGGKDYLNNELSVLLEQFATKVSVNPYIYVKVNEEDILIVKNQNDRYILPIEYQNVERLKRTKFYYYHSSEFYSLYEIKYGKLFYGQEKVKQMTNVAGTTGRHCGISGAVVQVDLANWQVSYSGNYSPQYLFTVYTEKPNMSNYTPQLGKYLQIQRTQYTYQISAESVDFNELLSIPNTATNGTITSAMLATLQISDENYIIFNNEIYLLQDKNTTDGFLVYTHNGHDSNDAYFQKCITITISTLSWVLNATQIATTSDIANAIGNALQGDY